jgi:hypothetical protein
MRPQMKRKGDRVVFSVRRRVGKREERLKARVVIAAGCCPRKRSRTMVYKFLEAERRGL